MPFHLHLPVTKAKPLPKKQDGPTADSLRAAAAELDRINSLATNSKISRFKELFSSDEEDSDKGEGEGKEHARPNNLEKRKHPKVLNFSNEREETQSTNFQSLKRPDTTNGKDNTYASNAKSPQPNPFKKVKPAHQKSWAGLDEMDKSQ